MKPTKFDVRFTDELLLSRGGWVLAGQLLGRTRLGERLGQLQLGGPGPRKASPLIGHGEVALSMIGLLCVAKPDFAAIEDEASEELLIESLGLERVPSEATLRRRLDELGSLQLPSVRRIVREESAAMILAVVPMLRPIVPASSGGTSGGTSGETSGGGGLIPLDIDVSPFDNSNTKKQGVSYTYKGMDGPRKSRRSSPTTGRRAICWTRNCVRAASTARRGSSSSSGLAWTAPSHCDASSRRRRRRWCGWTAATTRPRRSTRCSWPAAISRCTGW